jgi:hypothetical protein
VELGVKEGRRGRLESLDDIVGKPGFPVGVVSLAGLATIDVLVLDIVRMK